MKTPTHLIQARREKLQQLVSSQRYLPLSEIKKQLRVSEATIRRDLTALAHLGLIIRTRGGALSEFNERFPSFNMRLRRAARSKSLLASAALQVIRPSSTCFLDSGTTIFALAKALAASPPGPLRILTVNLPAAETLSSLSQFEVHLTGGQLLPRQSVLLGQGTIRSIESWSFDTAFLSAEAMDHEGLWNSQISIIAHQHAVVRRAKLNCFLLDRTKATRRAAHFLLPWGAIDILLTDVSRPTISKFGPDALRSLWSPGRPPPPTHKDQNEESLPIHFL